MKPLETGAKPQLTAEIRKIFTDAVTAFPGDFAKQAQHIVRTHRPAGLPERFQPLNMGLSDWERIRRERQRQRQEAEARERAQEQQAEQQGRDRERAAKAREEQKKLDEERIGEESCRQLEREMGNTPLVQIAERLKQEWQEKLPNVPISLTVVREPDVHIRSSDDILNRSTVGRKLSYTYQDYVEFERRDEDSVLVESGQHVEMLKKELTFGVTYDEGHFIPEAKQYVYQHANSNEKVISYFVQLESRRGSPWLIAVPVNYPGSLQKLYDILAEKVELFSPDKVIPEANLRIQQAGYSIRDEQPQKKSFWRRLIDG